MTSWDRVRNEIHWLHDWESVHMIRTTPSSCNDPIGLLNVRPVELNNTRVMNWRYKYKAGGDYLTDDREYDTEIQKRIRLPRKKVF